MSCHIWIIKFYIKFAYLDIKFNWKKPQKTSYLEN